VAANIGLAPLPERARAPQGSQRLSSLAHGAPAKITALDEGCQGFTRRRFLDLGLTPGTEIVPELTNAFGEPRAYRLRGTLIALRHDQAGMIWVRPRGSAPDGGRS
jgi:DtxR family Mn-dependent transcriptional regulator